MEKDLALFDALDRPPSILGRPLADVLVLALPLFVLISSRRLSIPLFALILLAYWLKRSLRRSIPPCFFRGAFYWAVLPPSMTQLTPAYKRFFLR